jgi:hypothetical protein
MRATAGDTGDLADDAVARADTAEDDMKSRDYPSLTLSIAQGFSSTAHSAPYNGNETF